MSLLYEQKLLLIEAICADVERAHPLYSTLLQITTQVICRSTRYEDQGCPYSEKPHDSYL